MAKVNPYEARIQGSASSYKDGTFPFLIYYVKSIYYMPT